MARVNVLPVGAMPRGLNRVMAAQWIGVCPTKFDEMVKDGRMPKPKRVDGRKIWDLIAVNVAFDLLPGEDETNPWDAK